MIIYCMKSPTYVQNISSYISLHMYIYKLYIYISRELDIHMKMCLCLWGIICVCWLQATGLIPHSFRFKFLVALGWFDSLFMY